MDHHVFFFGDISRGFPHRLREIRQVQGPPETRAIPAGPLPAPLVEQQAQVPDAGLGGTFTIDRRSWTLFICVIL